MRIDCMADLHGFRPKLAGGDLLIVAGDLTARDTPKEHIEFALWLANQKYDKKILIAGNHDGQMVSWKSMQQDDLDYLVDSGTTFQGLKIWGSPWTPTFLNWHFMLDRGEPIKQKWDLIPDDVDILVTHGPPFGVQDQIGKTGCYGCEELREAILRIKPKLHVFGHIHESPGICRFNGILCVNATIMNEHYAPVNPPIRILYDHNKIYPASSASPKAPCN